MGASLICVGNLKPQNLHTTHLTAGFKGFLRESLLIQLFPLFILQRHACRIMSTTHPATAEPTTPPPASHLTQPGRAQVWTSLSRRGSAWSGCSPGTAPWPGTPAPCRWASGRTPRPQTQRSGATSPCPAHPPRAALFLASPQPATSPGIKPSLRSATPLPPDMGRPLEFILY